MKNPRWRFGLVFGHARKKTARPCELAASPSLAAASKHTAERSLESIRRNVLRAYELNSHARRRWS